MAHVELSEVTPQAVVESGLYDESPFPRLTWRTSMMALLVSMGGLIFGFDTGQISGFLAMDNFRQRCGEFDPVTNTYFFSNVRSGLLVGMVRPVQSLEED